MRYAICSRDVRSAAIDPVDLEQLGRQTGRPAWQALAPFYAEYLANLDWQGAVDYSGLVRRTARLLGAPGGRSPRSPRDLRLVVVDEYQDTDPAQEQVLHGLDGGRRAAGGRGRS